MYIEWKLGVGVEGRYIVILSQMQRGRDVDFATLESAQSGLSSLSTGKIAPRH
jgi:hypothetical protein